MTEREREALRRRYGFRCGYCGVREKDVGAQLTVDHFQPTARGGSDDPENLVYCCHACNSYKSDYWAPESPFRVLHPLRDAITQHIAEQRDGTVVGLTDTGRRHIEVLHLNRPGLVAHRRQSARIRSNNQRRLEVLERLERLAQRVQELK